ncbi:MAG: hypothetical protein ABSF55_01395 [Candidatus Staskawiczbacteria bacterium]
MKKIILLALLIITGILGANQMVYADTSILSASPALADSTVGAPFNVSVQINPANNKVCVVQGTLVLSNLACQSITIASGVMPQTAPTCASPSFMLGIPGCSTAAQNLFSVSVSGTQAGQANLSFTGVDVIGAGADVPSSAQGGAYSITPVPAPAPTPTPTPVKVVLPAPATTQQTTTTTQQTTTTTPAPTQASNLAANGGPASFASAASPYFWPLLIILVIIVVGYGIYYFVKKKK